MDGNEKRKTDQEKMGKENLREKAAITGEEHRRRENRTSRQQQENERQEMEIQETEESQQEQEKKQKQYEDYVKQVTPVHSLPKNMAKAFLVGGLICVLGQWILNRAQALGLDKESAGAWCSGILILVSVILTGLNIYPKLARFAGAGSLVPITGFANSVAASAIEFQKEGQVMGIGCKIFTIAGPVILYGIFSSWVLGLIYWLLKIAGIL